jgi:hypothetical protein
MPPTPPERPNISLHISQEVSNINRSSAPATTTENNKKRCFDSLQHGEKVDNISRTLGDTSLTSEPIQSFTVTGPQPLQSTTRTSIDPVEPRPIAPLRRTRRFVRLSTYAVSSHQTAESGHQAAAVWANHGVGLVATYPLAVESKPAVKALLELEDRLPQNEDRFQQFKREMQQQEERMRRDIEELGARMRQMTADLEKSMADLESRSKW